MATYYKFKEREDPTKSMIDWAGITKTLSDGITAESKRRTDLKAELDNDYISQLNSLDEVTQGSNQSFNQAMLGFSHNYKDYLMNNHNMMKRGIISVNDSKMAKQGAKDSFTNLNNVAKNFDAQLQAIIDKGGNANDWLSEQAVNFIDLKNQQLLIDPTTGTASFGRFMEDGKTIDKATITPIGAMGQKFKPFERFDNDKEIADAVKGFSSIYKIPQGAYKSVSDIMRKPGVSEAIDKRIDAMIAGGKDISAAVDFLDMKLTSDESLKDDPDYIFVENAADGTMFKPKLTPDQAKKLKAALREQVVMGLDVEITQKEPSHAAVTAGTKKDNQIKLMNSLVKFVKTGDQATGNGLIGGEAADLLNGIKIDITGGTSTVTLSDGNTVTLDLKNPEGNTLSVGDLLVSIAPHLGIDNDVVDQIAQQYMDTPLAKAYPELIKKAPPKPPVNFNTQDNIEALNTSIAASVDGDYANVVRQLNAIASPQGIAEIKLNAETKDVYYENASGVAIILGKVDQPATVLVKMNEALGNIGTRIADGDSILNQQGEN